MIDCYRQLAEALRQGAVVLATVIASKGSVPREVGAKMIVTSAGCMGTIGGGAGEAKVIERAMQVLQTGQKQRLEIDLTGATHRETQGICGGVMQVWLERWSGAAAMALVEQILARLQTGQTVTLVTSFSEQAPYLLNSQDQPMNAFIETLYPPPTLLIVGAGHVGVQLAQVAHSIGFQIAIQDERVEWANAQLYPQASIILTEPIQVALTKLAAHQLFAALVTRGYQYDLAALTGLLKRELPCQYIGMIGSEKRVRQVFQAAIASGIAPEQLRSVYAPIGLDIGALTPAEIAVSIGAELILVRRGGTGRPLSEMSLSRQI